MRLLTVDLFSITLFCSATLAAPGLFERQGCDADNCLRAVRGTARIDPPLSSRSALCSSFLRSTVTLCPLIFVSTVYVTNTAATATTTVPQSTVQVVPTTIIASAYSTLIETNTLTTLSLVYATSTAATPTGVTTVAYIAQKREASICSASTETPSLVPAYASACSGAVRFSSACACIGVSGSVTTLPLSTSTSYVTKTVSTTPIASVTQTSTSTTTTSVFVTSTITTTASTDAVVTIVSTSSVVTTPSPVLSPVSVTLSCTSFVIQATAGSQVGQYVVKSSSDGSAFYFGSRDQAQVFVKSPGSTQLVADGSSTLKTDASQNGSYLSLTNGSPVSCQIGPAASLATGGALTCTNGAQSIFRDADTFIAFTKPGVGESRLQVFFAAVPACS